MCSKNQITKQYRSVPAAIRAAEAMGATCDTYEGAINLDAPAGKVWASTHTHTVVVLTEIWREPRKAADIAADIASDLSMGLSECTDAECEVCVCRAEEDANASN
jgi:hypothetical protein